MFTISKIQINLSSNWLSDAGLVGFLNCLDAQKGEYKILDGLGRGIEFDSSVLDNFEKRYYQYLQNKYEKFTSCYRFLSFQDDSMKLKNKDEITKEDIESLNKYIQFVKRKFGKKTNYTNVCENLVENGLDLIKEAKSLSEITKKEADLEQEELKKAIGARLVIIDKMIKFVEPDNTKKQFLVKDFLYNTIDDYYDKEYFTGKGEVSDLQKFKETFVNPVKDYIKLSDDEKEGYIYKCSCCGNPIKNMDEAFYTTPINNIGVDGKRKGSHFWNYNRNDLLCPICNLTHACIPLGFTHLKRQGLFINENISVKKLVNSNKHTLDKASSLDELEYSSYMDIANSFKFANVTNFEKELQNIQVVRYVDGKYKFNNLTSDIFKIMLRHQNEFRLLLNENILHYKTSDKNVYINMFSGVIDKICNREDLLPLIILGLKRHLEGEYIILNRLNVMLRINVVLKNGGDTVNCERSKELLESLDLLGRVLRYVHLKEGCENKIDGVTYAMLNAITSKNKKKFQEVFIRSYLYFQMNIPNELAEAMRDDELWQDYGIAFICGFRGSYNKEESENDNTDGGNKNE